MESKLKGIPETLLIPLWARAYETELTEAIIRDYKAVEMVSKIDYDFSKFEKSWMSQLGISIRTMLLDKATQNFLQNNHDAIIINLGAGLDTRVKRLKYANFHCWYDLDVPESINLRKKFINEGQHNKFIAKSMFDYSWMDNIINDGKPILIIAEGLFMYFEEKELKLFFKKLISQFPKAEILFEMLPPFLVGKAKSHESLRKLDKPPEFKWGLKNCREIETWNNGIKYIEEWDYYNYHKKRWKWIGIIGHLPFVRPKISGRIIHLSFI